MQQITNNFDYKKISVVTVVYNAQDCIEQTIQNILKQTYPNIEYVIIDGASTDNTLDIINRYSSSINLIISEKDEGIYDAMNKSIKYCNGEWIIFMNAGDYFYSDNIIEKIFNKNVENDISVIYGNHEVIYTGLKIKKYPPELSKLWRGMFIQHQSIFVRKNILQSLNFDLKFKFASDYNLIFFLYKSGYKFLNTNYTISSVTANGYSETNSIFTYLEFKNISLKYDKNISHKIYFYLLIPYRKFILFVKQRFKLNNLLFKSRY